MTRRVLLGGSLGALVLGPGCRSTPTPAQAALSVRTWSEGIPFYIAHRGGARDWPEMTAYGYDRAAQLPGLEALDISVCQTADGVLVCSFEQSTKRLTGHDLTIGKEDWSTLSALTVTAKHTNDPRQPRQPFARFDDVVQAHIGSSIIVVEPRDSQAAGNLMATLLSLGFPERVVWKQPVTSTRFAEAKRHGFATWGYVLDEAAHLGANLKRHAADDAIDMLGASHNRPDAFIANVARAARSQQKKMIGWDVRDLDTRARMLELGCTGIASSDITNMLSHPVTAAELPPKQR